MFDMEMRQDAARLKGKVVLVTAKGKPNKEFIQLFAQFGDF